MIRAGEGFSSLGFRFAEDPGNHKLLEHHAWQQV